MSSNPITWWEIQVLDLEQAKHFYGGVFGWTFKPWMEGFEAAYAADDSMVGGLRLAEGEPAGRGVHVCFTLDVNGDGTDSTMEETLERVKKHDGKVLAERTRISPEMGWYATAADPSGVSFDVWTGRAE